MSHYLEQVFSFQQLQLLVAQQYLQETELSKRVRQWEETVVPILAREVHMNSLCLCSLCMKILLSDGLFQEEHDFFDIHHYGEMILLQLEQLGVQQAGSSNESAITALWICLFNDVHFYNVLAGFLYFN